MIVVMGVALSNCRFPNWAAAFAGVVEEEAKSPREPAAVYGQDVALHIIRCA